MKKRNGFSLMEMMIVLLIVSILVAVAAPMINKKLSRSGGQGSPWNWAGVVGSSIFYNQGDDNTVSIGTVNPPQAGDARPKFYVTSDRNGQTQIALNRGNGSNTLKLTYDADTVWLSTNRPTSTGVVIGSNARGNAGGVVAVGNETNAQGANAVAIGRRASSDNGGVAIGAGGARDTSANSSSVAIGSGASANVTPAIAVGNGAQALAAGAITIGDNATSHQATAVAIGSQTTANGNSAIAIGSGAITTANNSIAVGHAQALTQPNSIAIGNNADVNSAQGISIGSGATATTGINCISIGSNATSRNSGVRVGSMGLGATGQNSIAIGNTVQATNTNSIAIGNGARATGSNSVALGWNTSAIHSNSIAIGATGNVSTTQTNQIMLGDSNTLVRVPGTLSTETLELQNLTVKGNLVVEGDTLLGGHRGSKTYLREDGTNNCWRITRFLDTYKNVDIASSHKTITTFNINRNIGSVTMNGKTYSSDRRLKNVGNSFTGGLEQIKKIEPVNFTFKSDKTKTPQVGVIAQDLKKIFPKAVVKGEDGFLKIRTDEILYALVNAVKELDNKIHLLEQKQKRIDELETKVQSLEKRLEALEKAHQ